MADNNAETHRVILSIASNHYQKSNLARTRQKLGEVVSDLHFTRELWTEPVGTNKRTLYLNQLASATTTLSLDHLTERLKQIETACGRTPKKRQLGLVPADIDILLYDDLRLHPADWQRPYVTMLLPEL